MPGGLGTYGPTGPDFGSWVPFPDNSGIDPARLADAEYPYVSHLHRDHRDEANVFPDQFVFLEYAREQGRDNVHMFLTGTTVELSPAASRSSRSPRPRSPGSATTGGRICSRTRRRCSRSSTGSSAR